MQRGGGPAVFPMLRARSRLGGSVKACMRMRGARHVARAGLCSRGDNLYKDQNDTWVDRHLPAAVQPYAKLARIDRPIGTYLLLFPGWWSIALATPSGSFPSVKYLALFGIGAFVMRGAGCTINDFWDRDIDGKVARTKDRPLASGRVSVPQALAFTAAQSLVGLSILVQLNTFTIGLGAASLVPVALYPLAKRVTNWPQAVLGLTINWGALCGYSAVAGHLDVPVVLPLYIGCAFWTLVYDTIYAYQDRAEDRALGLKSSALTIGEEQFRPVLGGFALAALGLWEVAGYNAGLFESFWFQGALAGTALHLGWQISTADLNDRLNLTLRFVSNQWIGALMFGGCAFGKTFL